MPFCYFCVLVSANMARTELVYANKKELTFILRYAIIYIVKEMRS